LHAISRLGAVAGKRALVTGCGPIGTLAIAALRFYGARTIVATDIAAGALALAARMGADEAVNVNGASGDLSAFKADKGYFDILVECSGSERALRTALECLRPRGTIIQLGLGGDIAIPINVLVAKELALCGSFRFHEEFSLAAELIARKRVDLAPLVTGTYAFQEAEQAFIAAGDRQHHMKVQLAF